MAPFDISLSQKKDLEDVTILWISYGDTIAGRGVNYKSVRLVLNSPA